MPHVETDMSTRSLRVPCPVCNGDGFVSHADRHVENAKESCTYCRGYGSVVPRTGETPQASASPEEDELYASDGYLPLRRHTKVVDDTKYKPLESFSSGNAPVECRLADWFMGRSEADCPHCVRGPCSRGFHLPLASPDHDVSAAASEAARMRGLKNLREVARREVEGRTYVAFVGDK